MFDIVSIGNATRDVFVELNAKKRKGCIALPCGSKQEVKSIFYSTGGSATNTSVAFARLGLRTGILAAIGKDDSGKAILRELKANKVDTVPVVRMSKFNTAYSCIVTGKGFDRIILTYGGATTHLQKREQINWQKLGQSRWFYVGSFHSKPVLLKKIFGFAKKKGIMIAWNPGKSEIKQGLKKLGPMLRKASILFLNKEEAAILARQKKAEQNARKLQKLVPLVVITRGKKGSIAFDGKKVYREGTRKIRVKDSTGAGDAFNAGFVTATMWGCGIEKALGLGARNAEAILVAMGAKNNLLYKKQAKKYT